MKRVVVYYMSRPAYLPYLIASLWSLRRHCQEHVIVYSYRESLSQLRDIATDRRLGIDVRWREPDVRGRNDQFFSKLSLMQSIDADVGVYLDADTIVVGPIDGLFQLAETTGFAATQISDCTVKGRFAGRVQVLKSFKAIDNKAINQVTSGGYPAMNGGVFASHPHSVVLQKWHDWTAAVRRQIMIADDTVSQLMQVVFNESNYSIARNGIFNASPHYWRRKKNPKTSIWHAHGRVSSNSPIWKRVFARTYKECRQLNLGDIQNWPSIHYNHPLLMKFFDTARGKRTLK